jgi:putative pyrroloquinoline-quinone binding quinoprotein
VTAAEPSARSVHYPGGLVARYRWVGSGQAAALFALTEIGGSLEDHGPLGGPEPDSLCRAELRVEGPGGAWTVRLASPIFDEPDAILWDTAGLLVVRYGFVAYAFASRSGARRWHVALGTPLVALLASSRLDHVLLQGEIETRAVRADGAVVWRVTHPDVIIAAALVGGRLVLTAYGGASSTLDPATGRAA